MIYESRPNVTFDAIGLALKSGNAVILKGGSDILNSNRAIAKVVATALKNTNVPVGAVQLIDSKDRSSVKELLRLKGIVDVIIPRGGKGLIDFVVQNSIVPVIETGASVVHCYVDKDFDMDKALAILVNSKCRRVSICNAMDTILIHKDVAAKILPKLAPKYAKYNVWLRADSISYKILKNAGYPKLKRATRADFGKEFLDYIASVKVVKDLDEALSHIYKYSLKHTEAIITENKSVAERFLKEVDAACVYVNTSTQFSDGAQFGLGAEIGISTQKLHARGPFALEGLTTYKWLAREGGIRK